MPSTSPRQKPIYWLSNGSHHLHQHRSKLLRDSHFEVNFCQDSDDLIQKFVQKKCGIIIISDTQSPNQTLESIVKVANHPETQGVKFTYCYSHFNEQLSRAAAVHAFRDIIPDDIDDKSWIERFHFAVGVTHKRTIDTQLSVSTREIALARVPSRVVAIGEQHIKIESRLHSTLGDRIGLSGPFAEALGLKRLSLVVASRNNRDLNYRFSDCITASWSIPTEASPRALLLLSRLRQNNPVRRCKVFIATKEIESRQKIIAQLDPLRFDVNVALQIQSLINEPMYFSPQVIIVDHPLLASLKAGVFSRMLMNLDSHTTVIVLGPGSIPETTGITDINSNLRIEAHNDAIDNTFGRKVLTQYLSESAKKLLTTSDGMVYLAYDHPFSTGDLVIPARLAQIHPRYISLQTPVRMQKYGLLRIESPMIHKALGFDPYYKIVSQSAEIADDSQFPFAHTLTPSDVSYKHADSWRISIAQYIAEGLMPKDSNALKQEEQSSGRAGTAFDKATHASGSIQDFNFKPYQEVPSDTTPLAPPPNPSKIQNEVRQLERNIQKRAQIKSESAGLVDYFASRGFRSVVTFIFISSVFVAFLYYFINYVEPEYSSSGKQFSDGFKKLIDERDRPKLTPPPADE